ncbi:MAG: Membrane protein insertase YidC [Alphaproteobacteria bacterium MarineAlpha2_Bin1]|nr:MAG: Membrane protein insertase YidC [Alphaproteobacteria bacterium MarineAlpha2_Bin1]|tara:strand:+ start:201 stop:2081 length:1881 start_codon:yes stop_codon:yes gene_type:complete
MLENKNLLIAIVLSIAILLGFQLIYGVPTVEKPNLEKGQIDSSDQNNVSENNLEPQVTDKIISKKNELVEEEVFVNREKIISQTSRVDIESEKLQGSIQLKGALFDDLTLLNYGENIDKNSKRITFLSPRNSINPYYASFGWIQQSKDDCLRNNSQSECEEYDYIELPNKKTIWKSNSKKLSPSNPVILEWKNNKGTIFQRLIEVDEQYMFKISDRVFHNGTKKLKLYPYGQIIRDGAPETQGFFILHEGPIGVFDGILEQPDYEDVVEENQENRPIEFNPSDKGGWIGITDKYWLTAMIPDKTKISEFKYIHKKSSRPCLSEKSNLINITPTTQKGPCGIFVIQHLTEPIFINPGGSIKVENHFFAGAKVVRYLDGYGKTLSIPMFDRAVDFGYLFFLTKPIFLALRLSSETFGNYGIAILIVTLFIKLIFFPIANRSYKAMGKMRLIAPEIKKIRERYKDNRQKQQQEMMALYKKEGANPISGCLPLLIQIPVFFALYKVLFVTIEMRHAPFFGWIQDLSAPDPLNLFTLFGLIPWTPPSFIPILGIWPLLMGISMWLQMRLNPQPMDPIQARIFMIMPIFFTFLLAAFPAGLVIYWTWNNVLSIAQQWVIMKKAGVKNPVSKD